MNEGLGATQQGRHMLARTMPGWQEHRGVGGDENLQDALAGLMKTQVSKARVEAFAEEKAKEIQDLGDMAKLEIDMAGIEIKFAAQERFERAEKELDSMWDDAEDMIRRVRQKSMENSLELQKWEADVAERRSEGQFFKSLYQAPKPQQDGKIRAASSAAPPDVPEAEDLDVYLRPARGRGGGEGAGARSPEERARDALRSPRRLGLYGYLGLVLVGTCVYEVAFAETPSAFHLGLYGFLSVCLAGNFLAERKHLDDDN